MGKVKTVTRKYFSKKLGRLVVKTYQYDYSNRKTRDKNLLVTKSGKIYEDRIEKFVKNMSTTDANEVRRLARKAKVDGKRFTTRTALSQLENDQKVKMLINAGYTFDEGLEELGVTDIEYLDEKNWDGSVFKNPKTGVSLRFVFNYNEGSVWQVE